MNLCCDPWQDSLAEEDVYQPSAKRHRGSQDTGPATPALVDQQAALTDGSAPAHPLGPLALLPPELLFRVLSFLSAEDLTAAAPTCRLIQHATGSGVLWRRLFIARCYRPQGHACALTCMQHQGKNHESTSWLLLTTGGAPSGRMQMVGSWGPGHRPGRCVEPAVVPSVSASAHMSLICVATVTQERYMERDTIEMQEVTKSVSTLLRPFYAQVHPYHSSSSPASLSQQPGMRNDRCEQDSQHRTIVWRQVQWVGGINTFRM